LLLNCLELSLQPESSIYYRGSFGLSPADELAELDATRAALARRNNAATAAASMHGASTTFGVESEAAVDAGGGIGSKRQRSLELPRGTAGQTGPSGAVDSAEPSPRDDDDDNDDSGARAFRTRALPSPPPPFPPQQQYQKGYLQSQRQGRQELHEPENEGATPDLLLDANELIRGARLFAWSADAHEAAWVVQRVWRKRQLRRGEAQTLIRRGFAGAAERAAYRDARADALRAATVLRHALVCAFV